MKLPLIAFFAVCTAIVIFVTSPQAKADFVSTDCKKWSDEGFGLFECSNEKAYAVGHALCTTIDSRRNGKANTSHAEKPIEIFCRWRMREDAKSCVNDGGPEVESCFKEYLSRGGASKAPKTNSSKTSN